MPGRRERWERGERGGRRREEGRGKEEKEEKGEEGQEGEGRQEGVERGREGIYILAFIMSISKAERDFWIVLSFVSSLPSCFRKSSESSNR
jgi:hypothetical protein